MKNQFNRFAESAQMCPFLLNFRFSLNKDLISFKSRKQFYLFKSERAKRTKCLGRLSSCGRWMVYYLTTILPMLGIVHFMCTHCYAQHSPIYYFTIVVTMLHIFCCMCAFCCAWTARCTILFNCYYA
jgi:hypothetical protein